MKYIKRLFCKHEYSKPKLKRMRYDYYGYRVQTWEKKCIKCGKRKRYKTW